MEQRKFERFSVNGIVTFVGDSVRGDGRIENLSLGGAAIASDVAVARGDYLQLTMTLPDQSAAIEVELAPVRWVKDHSFGVEFIRVSPTALQILQRYVERLGLVPDEPASSKL
jgi:PilZ domain-containing protein